MTEPAAIAIRAHWVTIDPSPAGLTDPLPDQAGGRAVPLRCWWARPEAQAPRGVVIVLPEVFGVNGWVRSVADRLAAAGYAALALNTMARTAPDLELDYDAAGLELGRQHRDVVTAAGCLDDLAASVAWIRAQPDLAGGPIGEGPQAPNQGFKDAPPHWIGGAVEQDFHLQVVEGGGVVAQVAVGLVVDVLQVIAGIVAAVHRGRQIVHAALFAAVPGGG